MAQDNFNVVGKNLILLSNMILNNQNLCKLLYYTTKNPLLEPDFETDILMNKNIRVVPKIPNFETENGSFILIVLDDFIVDSKNNNFKVATIRFDIICPIENWMINSDTLRPFAIMSEIDKMFNNLRINGIGTLTLTGAERIILSASESGYSMVFTNYEFN